MRFLCSVGLAGVVGLTLAAHSAQEPQRPPIFRTGVNLVRVDAYPSRDGKIIEGLTLDDFEVFEDGVLQKIESFQFIRYEQNNPIEERRDPNSQRDAFALAADPSRRVFVLYLDNLHVNFAGSHRIRMPIITFLNQVLGPSDLFGVLTTKQRPQDLMLGQQTQFIEEQLTEYWDWGQGARVLDDDEDLMLDACGLKALIGRRRLDEVFSDLEGLMRLLAGIREERKNVLLITNGWALPRADLRLTHAVKPRMPAVGVSQEGKLTLGPTGGANVSMAWCQEQLQRLSNIDFQDRMRAFLQLARQSNVTFYSLRPEGLAAPATVAGMRIDTIRTDNLLTLSDNTDGIAVVNTNDLTAGARRIANDLSGAYLLGYYPTNAKADVMIRKISVRLKSSKDAVRARREYRALTAEELATVRSAAEARSAPAPVSAADAALGELKRLRPGAKIHTRATILRDQLVLTTELTAAEVEAGRWKDGADVQIAVSTPSGEMLTTGRGKLEPGARAATIRMPLRPAPGSYAVTLRVRSAVEGTVEDSLSVAQPAGFFGDPLIFRLTTPSNVRPAGSVYFRRTERIRVSWPVSTALARREARVLGRDGVPLELAPELSEREEDGVNFLVVDLNLAALTAGEYIIEVTGTAGDRTESSHLAFRVFR